MSINQLLQEGVQMKQGFEEKKCHFGMGKFRFPAIPHSLGYYHCPGTAGHAVGTSESL